MSNKISNSEQVLLRILNKDISDFDTYKMYYELSILHEDRSTYILEEALHQYCKLIVTKNMKDIVQIFVELSIKYKGDTNLFPIIQDAVGTFAISNSSINLVYVDKLLQVIPNDYWAYKMLTIRKDLITLREAEKSGDEAKNGLTRFLETVLKDGIMWAVYEVYSYLNNDQKKHIENVSNDKDMLTKSKRHELRMFLKETKQ